MGHGATHSTLERACGLHRGTASVARGRGIRTFPAPHDVVVPGAVSVADHPRPAYPRLGAGLFVVHHLTRERTRTELPIGMVGPVGRNRGETRDGASVLLEENCIVQTLPEVASDHEMVVLSGDTSLGLDHELVCHVDGIPPMCVSASQTDVELITLGKVREIKTTTSIVSTH